MAPGDFGASTINHSDAWRRTWSQRPPQPAPQAASGAAEGRYARPGVRISLCHGNIAFHISAQHVDLGALRGNCRPLAWLRGGNAFEVAAESCTPLPSIVAAPKSASRRMDRRAFLAMTGGWLVSAMPARALPAPPLRRLRLFNAHTRESSRDPIGTTMGRSRRLWRTCPTSCATITLVN